MVKLIEIYKLNKKKMIKNSNKISFFMLCSKSRNFLKFSLAKLRIIFVYFFFLQKRNIIFFVFSFFIFLLLLYFIFYSIHSKFTTKCSWKIFLVFQTKTFSFIKLKKAKQKNNSIFFFSFLHKNLQQFQSKVSNFQTKWPFSSNSNT